MTKTLTEDPSEFVRLVLTLFILGPIGSPDNSILIFFPLQNLSLEKKLCPSCKTSTEAPERICKVSFNIIHTRSDRKPL